MSLNPNPEISEVYFFGQIEGASNMQEGGDAIFVEYDFQFGDNWTMKSDGKRKETQCGYVDEQDFVCFAHPFNAHFSTSSYFGWPKLVCRVWKLDETDTVDLIAYGTLNLPMNKGFHKMEFDTWVLHGNREQEAKSYFLDSKPNMNSIDPVANKLDYRAILVTKPGPKIHVNIEVMLRNFKRNRQTLVVAKKEK